MAIALTPVFAVLIALSAAVAQQPASPSLQPRSKSPADERPVVVLLNHAASVLPEDASGLYRFGDKEGTLGEGIQIDEQFGDVTGYLTTRTSEGGGKGTLVGYFFTRIEGGGGELNFTTKAVHGVWYSFEGKVVRGPGMSRAQDGFYLLDGTLIAHDDTRQTTQRQTISLKLTALH